MTTNNTKDHPESSWTQRLRERDRNRRWTENRLLDLDYPGLYLGDELNTFHFDWDRAVREETIDGTWRIALINLIASQYTFAAPAVMLFYEQLHACDPDWVVERSLCPPSENDQNLMKEDGIRPFAVESKMPLEAFDAVCLSMDLSNSGAAVPWLLLESGIPICSTEREQKDPYPTVYSVTFCFSERERSFCRSCSDCCGTDGGKGCPVTRSCLMPPGNGIACTSRAFMRSAMTGTDALPEPSRSEKTSRIACAFTV